MRRALNEFLIEAVAKDSSIIFITGDLGFGVFDEFRAQFPNNYLNAGIAESNMVAVASGLSAAGFKPIVYSIASFMTSRPYEFIKILSAYNENPVIFIGAGGGLAYAMSGSTHHALDDLGLMLNIPEMNVFTPAGPKEMTNQLWNALISNRPTYLRIGKFGEKDLLPKSILEPYELVQGSTTAILSHSNFTEKALQIAAEAHDSHGIQVAVIHFPTLRPVEWNQFFNQHSKYENLLVFEEHLPLGGLYTELLMANSVTPLPKKIIRFGPPNKFFYDNLSQNSIAKKYKYSVGDILSAITKL